MSIRNVVSLVAASVLATACVTFPEPTDSVSVRIENPAIADNQGLSARLTADARLINESSATVTPYLCATVRAERQVSPGQFVDVTADIECAASTGTSDEVAPHSVLVIRLAVPLKAVAPPESTYRISFPVFIGGQKNSWILTSEAFVASTLR
jgi:hypothetical protein